jgi:hypothetical protein
MRITEGQLRRIIRETLLTEARWTPRVLADKGMKIFVQRKPGTAIKPGRLSSLTFPSAKGWALSCTTSRWSCRASAA